MKIFMDTEFLEGSQKTKLLMAGPPTIDLISIGLVTDSGKEYYAISSDFNLNEAWNRHDKIKDRIKPGKSVPDRNYWIRDNVLYSIYADKISADMRNRFPFNYRTMRMIINEVGKSNALIAVEIMEFVYGMTIQDEKWLGSLEEWDQVLKSYQLDEKPTFYTYYGAYDWVLFCWLFGRMIDLPKGFPMFPIDLKQMMEERGLDKAWKQKNCPDPINEHNALADARWNKELYHKIINNAKQ